MPEIKKYSTKDELLAADEKYHGSTSVVGKSSLTFPGYINSTRTQMFTSHLGQFLNLLYPQFPYMFTGAENTVGKHSTGYKKAKGDYLIYKKVAKFEDLMDEPYYYYLFFYDKKKKRYDVIERKYCEELGEDFTYLYDNEEIDKLQDGDIVEKGDVLYKSVSYDESMNYRYGRNATVIFTLDSYTSEDAAEISSSFSKAMSALKEKSITFGINLNDIPKNLYGDEDNYKVIPDIGEYCGGIIMATQTMFNEQVLYDMTDNNLRRLNSSDRKYYSLGENSKLVDITIYANDELLDNSFYQQFIKYKKSQDKFYKKLKKTCDEIINSGEKYSNEIDYLWNRAKEFLDENSKWQDSNDSTFGNLKIIVKLVREFPLDKGGKFTGRMGNKSVVSRVVPDEDMPFTDTGKRVDVILNLLAIINRTTGFVPHELYSTFILDRTRERMAKMTTLKEKEKLLFQIVKDFSEIQYESMYEHYKTLSKKEKEEYMNDCIYEGIHIWEMPIWEESPIFYRLYKMYKKYDWLKPYKMYQRKWGQTFETLTPMIVGEMYMIRLKQTSERGFSARNEGAVNQKGLPERSYKNRNNTEFASDSAIRSGEFETLTYNTAMSSEDIALWHAFYRSSVKGRKDLARSIFKTGTKLKIDDSYDIRSAELFGVIFKALSLRINFKDSDNEFRSLDSVIVKEHHYDGKVFMMTDLDYYMMKVRDEIREKIQERYPIITQQELDAKIEEELESVERLICNKTSK